MNEEKMRQEFEIAIKIKFPRIHMLRVNRPGSPVDGEYEHTSVELAWWAWQTSRQAVVVELPEPWEHYAMGEVEDPDMVLGHHCVVKAIEAAGLRCEVKP